MNKTAGQRVDLNETAGQRVDLNDGVDSAALGQLLAGGQVITENSTPKRSVIVANRPYIISSGSPQVPPAAMARCTTTSPSDRAQLRADCR